METIQCKNKGSEKRSKIHTFRDTIVFDIFVVGNVTKLRQGIKDKEKSSHIFM